MIVLRLTLQLDRIIATIEDIAISLIPLVESSYCVNQTLIPVINRVYYTQYIIPVINTESIHCQ